MLLGMCVCAFLPDNNYSHSQTGSSNSCDLQFAKLAKGEIKEFGLKFFITRLPLNCQSSTYSLTTSIPMLTKDVPSLDMYWYIDILIPRPTLLLFCSFCPYLILVLQASLCLERKGLGTPTFHFGMQFCM